MASPQPDKPTKRTALLLPGDLARSQQGLRSSCTASSCTAMAVPADKQAGQMGQSGPNLRARARRRSKTRGGTLAARYRNGGADRNPSGADRSEWFIRARGGNAREPKLCGAATPVWAGTQAM